jgi:hypothetical protein
MRFWFEIQQLFSRPNVGLHKFLSLSPDASFRSAIADSKLFTFLKTRLSSTIIAAPLRLVLFKLLAILASDPVTQVWIQRSVGFGFGNMLKTQ